MKFGKGALTFEDQAELLLSRGMAGDRALMVSRLRVTNYYRLSGYSFPFKLAQDIDDFKPGTTFDHVWERYVFDRKLRLLVMDALERIEIAIRTLTSYHHARMFGPFGYAEDPKSMPGLDHRAWAEFRDELRDDVLKSSKETFVDHFLKKYGDEHKDMPIWAVCEVLTFRKMLTILNKSPNALRTHVSREFNVAPDVLESWMHALNIVRNICAHHARLWNRTFGVAPRIPSAWSAMLPPGTKNNKLFFILTVINACVVRISPGTQWAQRLVALLDEYPYVPRPSMGFTGNWKSCSLWKNLQPVGAEAPR